MAIKMTKTNRKTDRQDKSQSSIFDFGDLSEEEKTELNIQLTISHENHIEDSKLINEKYDDDKEEQNLRSEQIHISKDNYPTISDSDSRESIFKSIDSFSGCNHHSKNLYNQCLFQIRQAFFGKIDTNNNGNEVDEKEKELRIKIRSALNKFKKNGFNHKNTIYKLLDKYFKDKNDDNYTWSVQAAQQIIDMAAEAWYDNDLAREDYQKHPEKRADYTGKPGICNYRRGTEYISVFTNQQCKIETKDVLIIESMNEERLRYTNKNFLAFPDHLNIKPIETRLSGKTDLREVRIIPLIRRGFYKIELIYKKVIDKIKIKNLDLDQNRIIGIDTGQENVVTIANNIGKSSIIIKGGILLAINQWFDKIGSKLYQIYYRQQKHQGKESKGHKIIMGDKMKILSQNRTNSVLDILHKISRFIVNYCVQNKIGTIVWGRNPGWKQNINIGKRNNQKFTKIPHYLLFKLLKYKVEDIGIKVIDIEESHTSKCSFLDNEPIGHKEKGQYVGKRTKRGLFRSTKGIIINADVNAAYNMIRKVFPDAFNTILKTVGIDGIVLHPERLSIKDLLTRPNTC